MTLAETHFLHLTTDEGYEKRKQQQQRMFGNFHNKNIVINDAGKRLLKNCINRRKVCNTSKDLINNMINNMINNIIFYFSIELLEGESFNKLSFVINFMQEPVFADLYAFKEVRFPILFVCSQFGAK